MIFYLTGTGKSLQISKSIEKNGELGFHKGDEIMYKNIIFDIGNVLLNFKPEEYLKSKLIELDKVPQIHKEIFQSKEWIMLDRGTITEEDAKNTIIKRVGENGHFIELAFKDWYEILTPIEGTVEILKELKNAEYRVYYLSNFHLLAFEHVTRKYDFFEIFDGGVVSYKVNLIKPEENIYKNIVEEYQLKPEESILIDDTQANIEGARKLNFGTILFNNPEELRQRLKRCNICLG
jgi:putative hydrolase of the HAD superfamily